MDIQVLDFTKICRTCLGFDHEMKFLFADGADENNELADIRKMIADCTIYPVINDDHYPNKICSKCINDVRIAFEFKSQCEKAFEMLSSVIESYRDAPKIDSITYPEMIFVKNVNIKQENTDPSPNTTAESKDEADIDQDESDEFMSSLTHHKCSICSKVFSREAHLRKHLSAVHPNVANTCNVCNKNCLNSIRLKKHMALCHPDKSIEDSEISNVIKCNDCLETFDSDEILSQHVCKNDDTFDPTNVESILGLTEEKDEEQMSDDDFFNDTGESYGDPITQSTNSDEDEHTPIAELRGPNTIDGENAAQKNSPETKSAAGRNKNHSPLKKEHRCEVCHKYFSRSTHLKRHSFTHAERKPFSCSVCHKGFTRADHLNLHMAHHVPVKPHNCTICNRGFIRAEHLRKHIQSRHTDKTANPSPKTDFCAICGKGFTTAKYLQIHMKSHMDKTWTCKFCPEKFNAKLELAEHSKTHAHEKPFLCSECGLRFVRNDYLVIHMRRHKGEKPYKCKFCNKGFPRATDLNVHERYHTGEKTHLCTVCGKGFQRAYNLLVHMRVHTGERPYKCPHCAKSFAQGNDLKAHVRRHTGERFKCDICGDGFIQGYHLTQHKRNVHGIDMKSHIRRVAKFTTPTEQQQQMEVIQQQKIEPESSNIVLMEDVSCSVATQKSEDSDEPLQSIIKIEDTLVGQETLEITVEQDDGEDDEDDGEMSVGDGTSIAVVDGNNLSMVFTQFHDGNKVKYETGYN